MPSFPQTLSHTFFAFCLFISRARGAVDLCTNHEQSREPLIVHEEAVSINTDVLWNTTFYAAPGLAVTVTNAPTSLDLITTFRWTEPRSSYTSPQRSPSTASIPSLSSASASPTALLQDATYIMGVMDRGSDKKHRKRQSGAVCTPNKSRAQSANAEQIYMNGAGAITNDCTASPIYAISNGRLTAIANGTVYSYSTSPGLPYAMFIPAVTPGPIATTFNIGGGGALAWYNDAFYNGQASFCALNNGTIYAVFQLNGQPDGCIYIQLNMFSASSCQGLQLSTITGPTGPTGPSGPQGSQGIQGNQGAQGVPGSVGPTGATGVAGSQGIQGIAGPSGPQGASGLPGVSGAPGASGQVGAVGPTGATGISGQVGAVGPTGPTGASGQIGAVGPTGATGVSGQVGQVGPTGPAGVQGVAGIQGIQGPVGPSGPQGLSGLVGATGSQGPTGTQGLPGSTGPSGPSGPAGPTGSQGLVGPSGPSGAPGPSGIPGVTYAYIGCYIHSGSRTSTTGLALPLFQTTYTATINDQCKSRCALGNFNYFGTVNVGTTSGDCWCGNAISAVTVSVASTGLLGLGATTVSGPAGDQNCYTCNGGGVGGSAAGACGNQTVSTMAIYAKGF